MLAAILWLLAVPPATPDVTAETPAPAPVVVPDAGADAAPAPPPEPTPAAEPAAPPAWVAAPAAAPPTTVTLRGVVLEKGTRQPLSGASVTVGALPSIETDAFGRFQIDVPVGSHHLLIQHPGHEPIDTVAAAGAGSPELIFRTPPRQTGDRFESVVKPPEEEAPKFAIDGDEMTKTPGSFGDPLRVIESLPGVSQVVWPLAIYAIRGANPGNTGFFIDGLRVPALFHFALGPSVIDPYFLRELDFYPGGYPARYGRYVSGVIAANTAAPPSDRIHASADVRIFDAGGIATSPWDGDAGTVALAVRYSYTGAIFSALSSDVRLGYGDYQLRLDHRLGPGRFTVFAFGSADAISQQSRDDAHSALDFHRLELRWEGAALGGRLRAGAAVGADTASTTLIEAPIKVRTWSAAPRIQLTRPIRSATLEVGVDAEAQRFEPTTPPNQGDLGDLVRVRSALSLGAFTSLILRGGSRVVVAPGVRYDAFLEQDVRRYEPGPRLMVRVRPSARRDLWLKATGGRFAQMASVPLSVPGFEAFSLKTLGIQTSLQGALGLEAPVAAELTIDASGFYQKYTGLTDVACPIDCRDIRRESFFAKRDGRGYGLELMLRRPSSKRLYGWLAYTLSWSDRDFAGTTGASDWDQRHILNLVGSYRLPRGYSVGGRVHYNTGRPYPIAAPAGVEYLRLPPFYQLDVRADRRFVLDRYVLDVYVELVNATLTREVVSVTREAGILQQQGFRIVLPSIGVHGEF